MPSPFRKPPAPATDPAHFPLASAFLCLDCSAVSTSAVRCPACASEALMGLAAVLERDSAA